MYLTYIIGNNVDKWSIFQAFCNIYDPVLDLCIQRPNTAILPFGNIGKRWDANKHVFFDTWNICFKDKYFLLIKAQRIKILSSFFFVLTTNWDFYMKMLTIWLIIESVFLALIFSKSFLISAFKFIIVDIWYEYKFTR